jgi:hypothetical protein
MKRLNEPWRVRFAFRRNVSYNCDAIAIHDEVLNWLMKFILYDGHPEGFKDVASKGHCYSAWTKT